MPIIIKVVILIPVHEGLIVV